MTATVIAIAGLLVAAAVVMVALRLVRQTSAASAAAGSASSGRSPAARRTWAAGLALRVAGFVVALSAAPFGEEELALSGAVAFVAGMIVTLVARRVR